MTVAELIRELQRVEFPETTQVIPIANTTDDAEWGEGDKVLDGIEIMGIGSEGHVDLFIYRLNRPTSGKE